MLLILIIASMILFGSQAGAEDSKSDLSVDDLARQAIERFGKYDVQWVGTWENDNKYPYVHQGEGMFTKNQPNGDIYLYNANGKLVANLGSKIKFSILQSRFKNGLCLVQDNQTNAYGIINNKGELIVPTRNVQMGKYSEGLCWFEDPITMRRGYVDTKGNIVIKPRFMETSDFKNGVALVADENWNYGYINKKGETVIPFLYSSLGEYGDLILAVRGRYPPFKYSFIDRNGKTVLDLKGFQNAGEFSEDGLAQVAKNGKIGYIDKTGKLVIPCKFTIGGKFSEGLAYASLEGNDNLAGINEPNIGYINTKGEFVIPCQFRQAEEFREGRAIVSNSTDYSKYGIIDKTGKLIAEKECDVLYGYKNGLTMYRAKDVAIIYGYLDKNGRDLSEGRKVFYVGDYEEGLISYGRDIENGETRRGYFDEKGNIIIEDEAIYRTEDFENGAAAITLHVQKGKEHRYITGYLKNPIRPVTAAASASKIIVDGRQVNMEAYSINGNNYFKLRDLAKVLSDTTKHFDVTWDTDKKAINILSNKAYTDVGGEMSEGDGNDKPAVLNLSKVYRDGQEVYLRAYTINGNNYFRLRDVTKEFNIGITWDSSSGTIRIDTNSEYVE